MNNSFVVCTFEFILPRPLGQGSISIAGDGGLRQWQINNKISHDAHVPDSFFAIRYLMSFEVLFTWNFWTGMMPASKRPVSCSCTKQTLKDSNGRYICVYSSTLPIVVIKLTVPSCIFALQAVKIRSNEFSFPDATLPKRS